MGLPSERLVNQMKTTTLKYCGECQRDFKPGEIVWYAWIENRCFCATCKDRLQIQDWEPRKVPERSD